MTQEFTLSLVGEALYQRAVTRCKAGEIVDICLEPDNPDDAQALVVKSRSRPPRTIGYISRDSGVHGFVHDEGKGLAAEIADVAPGDSGLHEVWLRVSVVDQRPGTASWEPDDVAAWRDSQTPERPLEPGDFQKRNKEFYWVIAAAAVWVVAKIFL
jgi:hypothetical protein